MHISFLLFVFSELADLPLIRLDFSCNKITEIPPAYRKLRQLQHIILDNNPMQSPPAQVWGFALWWCFCPYVGTDVQNNWSFMDFFQKKNSGCFCTSNPSTRVDFLVVPSVVVGVTSRTHFVFIYFRFVLKAKCTYLSTWTCRLVGWIRNQTPWTSPLLASVAYRNH